MQKFLQEIKQKKVLVTGGLGFVGQNLVKTLAEEYACEVTVVDDCSNANENVLNSIKGNIRFHKISVVDTDKLYPLIAETEYLFHLACVQISKSSSDPFLDLQVNAEGTLHILEYLRHNPNPNFKRLIYTSSSSIYGSASKLPIEEGDRTNVLSHYAATKLLAEHYCNIYHINYDVPVSMVRYSNVYGYGQTPRNPYCGVLGKFVHNALVGEPLLVIGDGEQTRDYTFITDAVNATILAGVHPKALGDVFNIGTSTETSVNQMAEIISDYVANTTVQTIPERDIDNIRRRFVSIAKISQRLGWYPEVSIKKGIELTIEWYKNTL